MPAAPRHTAPQPRRRPSGSATGRPARTARADAATTTGPAAKPSGTPAENPVTVAATADAAGEPAPEPSPKPATTAKGGPRGAVRRSREAPRVAAEPPASEPAEGGGGTGEPDGSRAGTGGPAPARPRRSARAVASVDGAPSRPADPVDEVTAVETPPPPATAGNGHPPTPVEPPGASVALPDDRFLDRELSWLDFNARVLTLAENPATPLLERAKFLAIFATNLDEFYMVRVAGLKRRLQTGLPVRSGQSLREQLDRIAARSADLVARHARCFTDEVLPALENAGVSVVTWAELRDEEKQRLRAYFRDKIFPVLTPLAVDPAHPFPYISGLSLNLAVLVRDPDGGPELFARVKVPNNVPRLVHADPGRFLPLEELIAAHLGELFSGMQIVEHHLFRVTRNAEVELDDDRDEDLLQALERELARRRFGPPVRLEVAEDVSEHVLELLSRELDMDPQDVLRIPGLLNLAALWQVYDETDRPELKDRPFVPATHPRFAEGEVPRSVFATLRDGDILVHHPYHSFSTSVQRFIEQAAADPNVLAIKQTLYRTSGDSPVVDALVDAAEAGKQVVVIVEIKARFDEVANIGWARTLEKAGCHVVYGLVGLKTHCKAALVVRQEGDRIRRYAHIGTGNYHPKTARLYEDFGLLTADGEVGADLTDLFNVLTGYSRQTGYRRLLVAPHGVRSGIIERIDAQAARAAAGLPALIQIKVNALVDEEIIDALYRASIAGVSIELVVRGICALRPGVPGLSENIRVRSILGRFLEHARIFRFGLPSAEGQEPGPVSGPSSGAASGSGSGEAGGEPENGGYEVWMGSADLMHRNLDRRVEALVRVTDGTAVAELARVLELSMSERISAFELRGDGTWEPPSTDGEGREHLQDALLRRIVYRSTE